MKSILASLVSFFLAATFSNSASCLHVSAAEIHTPDSAIPINSITVRAEQPDTSVDVSPSIHKPNFTSPNGMAYIKDYDQSSEQWPWDDPDADGIKCATISGRGKSVEPIVGQCRIWAASGDPGGRGCEAALDPEDEGWITPEEGCRCIELYQIEPANWTGIFYVDCPK